MLDREALLGTTWVGANYYTKVDEGPAESALKEQMRILGNKIDIGEIEHQLLAADRRKAFPGVVEISDLLGGADFPSLAIWDMPNMFLSIARTKNVDGNIRESGTAIYMAAILTQKAAEVLAKYIEDTRTGAGRMVTVLEVAKTAGEVAVICLAVTGVVGVVRGTVAAFGEAGAAGARATTSGLIDATAKAGEGAAEVVGGGTRAASGAAEAGIAAEEGAASGAAEDIASDIWSQTSGPNNGARFGDSIKKLADMKNLDPKTKVDVIENLFGEAGFGTPAEEGIVEGESEFFMRSDSGKTAIRITKDTGDVYFGRLPEIKPGTYPVPDYIWRKL
jgi:hypothetical protein